MVDLTTVRTTNTALLTSHPLVAVFIGGTSGIGQATAIALANTHADRGKGLRIYIVGRSAEGGATTIAECKRACPTGQFRFVQARDLALLKDVDRVCKEIGKLENEAVAEAEAETGSSGGDGGGGGGRGGPARIDLLVMSQAIFSLMFQSRTETAEGLDTNLSLLYYSRARCLHNLLPLLRTSTLPSGARAISIYAAGKETSLNLDDLSLRKPKNYGMLNVRSHGTYMTTLFMEGVAERELQQQQNPKGTGLGMVHVFPGLVVTDAFNDPALPLWFRVLWGWMLGPVAKLFVALSREESGQRTLFLGSAERFRVATREQVAGREQAAGEGKVEMATGTNGIKGSGVYAVNYDAETIPTDKAYAKIRGTDAAQRVWDHTIRVFEEIEAGGVFKG